MLSRIILCSILYASRSINVSSLEGVQFPESVRISSSYQFGATKLVINKEDDIVNNDALTLNLNGQGVRSIWFFGMDVKVYVAGMYSREPLRTEEDVMSCNCPIQFDFTFLRSVGQGRVTAAWTKQLAHSVSYHYEGFEKDRDSFISMFGPIEYKGTESVILFGDSTIIIDQGELKGEIQGRDFQKAFLSMWFGERAVAADLKAGLLGHHKNNNHAKLAQVVV